MNSVDFCFWLQGYFEMTEESTLNEWQVECVKKHLHLVFKHEIDPMRETETLTSATELNTVHNGTPPFANNTGNDTLIRC